MLAIGRALMAEPKVLLLDEPSMGLAPILVEQIFDIIKEINAQGTTVLLVEQNALMALAIANRGYILQTGEIVLSDKADGPGREPGGPRRLPRGRLTGPAMTELRRVSGPPSRFDRHLGRSSRSSSSAVLIAIVKPWGGRRRHRSPSRQPDRRRRPPSPTPSPSVAATAVYDFLTFGTNEPPPRWEIWPAGNLASFPFAMRIDLRRRRSRRRPTASARTGARRSADARSAVGAGRAAERRSRRSGRRPDPGRQPPRPDRHQSAARFAIASTS